MDKEDFRIKEYLSRGKFFDSKESQEKQKRTAYFLNRINKNFILIPDEIDDSRLDKLKYDLKKIKEVNLVHENFKQFYNLSQYKGKIVKSKPRFLSKSKSYSKILKKRRLKRGVKNKGITARDKPKRVKNYLPHLWSQRTFTDGVLRYSKQKIGEIKEDSDEEGSDAPKKNLEVITFFNQANTKTNLSNKFRSLSSSPRRTLDFQMRNNKKKIDMINRKSQNLKKLNKEFEISKKLVKKRMQDLNKRLRIKDKNNYLIKSGFKIKNKDKDFGKTLRQRTKALTFSQKSKDSKEIIKHNIGVILKINSTVDNKRKAYMKKITSNTAAPVSRERATLNMVNGNLIMVGGYNYNSSEISFSYNFDITSWRGLKYPPYFPKLAGHTSIVIKDFLLIFGGLVLMKAIGKMQRINDAVITYSDSYGWDKRVIPYSMSKRSHHCCVVVGTDILIFGGLDEQHRKLNDWSCLSLDLQNMSLNDWEAVNINNSGNFPALSNHAMCLAVHKDFRVRCLGRLEYLKGCTSMGDKLEKIAKLEKSGIYIYGGLNYDNKVSDSLIFLTVDGLSQEWKTIKPTGKSPPPLYDHTMDFMKPINSIAIFGGKVGERKRNVRKEGGIFAALLKKKTDNAKAGSEFNSTLYLFDIVLRFWQRVKIVLDDNCILQPRSSHCSAVEGDKLFIFGGINDVGLLDANLYQITVDHQDNSTAKAKGSPRKGCLKN